MLKPVLPLEETPGFAASFAAALARTAGKVCATCGLEALGHAPESRWLGYERHPWDGVPADDEQLARARQLSTQAYRNRS